MIIISILFLVVTTLIGGMMAQFVGLKSTTIKLPLVFAGSYLFSVTIIHILPEIISLSERPIYIGIFILLGFFLQQVLEYFTSGIEHGHFHHHEKISQSSRVSLITALVIHSLLEGALLTHDSPFHERHESYSLLLGIVLHKMPAAFALMSMMSMGKRFLVSHWIILIVFAISSPLGLLISAVITLSPESLLFLFALVSGSFLHISTTIFVESSPEHRFGFTKMFVSVIGAAVAILAELFI